MSDNNIPDVSDKSHGLKVIVLAVAVVGIIAGLSFIGVFDSSINDGVSEKSFDADVPVQPYLIQLDSVVEGSDELFIDYVQRKVSEHRALSYVEGAKQLQEGDTLEYRYTMDIYHEFDIAPEVMNEMQFIVDTTLSEFDDRRIEWNFEEDEMDIVWTLYYGDTEP